MNTFCMTIAGSDPSSGAGIQADLRTFDRCGIHAFSIITAITYQTATEFLGFRSLSDDLSKQLDSILITYPVKYVKIGMIPDIKALEIIIEYIKKYNLTVVLDPVTISSAGKRLSTENLEAEIEEKLFPFVKILTPNIYEAMSYSGIPIETFNFKDVILLRKVANIILEKLYSKDNKKTEEKGVIIKSGLQKEDKIIDFALINKNTEKGLEKRYLTYEKTKINIKGNIHGSGCVFSSAVTAFLSKGNNIQDALNFAETFFNEKFQKFIELPNNGSIIDLKISDEELNIINQIKEIYNFISNDKRFSRLIPEVRLNISGSLPYAKDKFEIAGIEGRVTIINGYPYACGEIKFGVSDHTARLILAAKEFDNKINFVLNLKYQESFIKRIEENTDLTVFEFKRESESDESKKKEHATMELLIKQSIENTGQVPDIIWDKGALGKEPIIRLFGITSKNIIKNLEDIINAIE